MEINNDFDLDDINNALEVSGTGMWKLISKEGEPNKFYGDKVFNELMGLTIETSPEDRYRFFISHIYPSDTAVFASYAENLKTEQSELIYRYDHPTKGLIYVRCGGKRDASVTDYACYRGFHQDITETVRIEQEKRRQITEQAELYQKMSAKLMENFTSSAMYIDLKEKDYTWLCCNDKRVEGIEGYGNLGRTYASYMPEEYAAIFLENASIHNLAKVLSTEDEYSFSVYMNDEDGTLRRTTMWYCVVDDSRRYVLGVSKDTTEDYLKEQELAQALLDADRANKAKSIFLNNMSHDIRTPMNAIIGFKDLARKHIDDKEKCLDYLTKIGISSEHLLSLINDVLDMSRIESGKMKILESSVSLSEILNEIDTLFMTGAREKGIDFQISSDEIVDDNVICDKLRLNQILLNCISNAIKFTESGGKVDLIVKQLGRATDGEGIYEFIIRDTGIGMSDEFQTTIFDQFTRDENGQTRQIQGTGLGMSICKSIVDMFGGEIHVDSKLGEGSTFTIRLKLKKSDIVNPLENERDDSQNDFSIEGRKILLVEDNDLNREIAIAMFAEYGIELEIAENGKIAVDMVAASEEGYYDCILMDIQMPVMDGYEATAAIRKLPRNDAEKLVIIAMTANAFEEDKQHAKTVGMNEHVSKPVDGDKLFSALRNWL